jgi:hypothetical protein
LGGFGVGVDEGNRDPYLLSIAARIVVGVAPVLNMTIASRATSRQIVQPMPWVSHSVTRPLAARDLMKHS